MPSKNQHNEKVEFAQEKIYVCYDTRRISQKKATREEFIFLRITVDLKVPCPQSKDV